MRCSYCPTIELGYGGEDRETGAPFGACPCCDGLIPACDDCAAFEDAPVDEAGPVPPTSGPFFQEEESCPF